MSRNCSAHFLQGLAWPIKQVDWNTRHNSRCYAAGIVTQAALFIFIPVAACIGIGFVIGRLI